MHIQTYSGLLFNVKCSKTMSGSLLDEICSHEWGIYGITYRPRVICLQEPNSAGIGFQQISFFYASFCATVFSLQYVGGGGVASLEHNKSASCQRMSCQARKRHINRHLWVHLPLVRPWFVPGANPVCPWDEPGLSLGQTQVFFLFYTAESAVLSQGQRTNRDEGRQKTFMY